MAQFVPLRIETGEKEQWQTWASMTRYEGNGIPIVYMVRADGEQLYGKSGALTPEELPKFLVAHLKRAGRLLTSRQLAQVEKTLRQAQKLKDDGNAEAAVKTMLTLRKIGPLGALGSYAEIALEADAYYVQLEKMGQRRLARAREELADEATVFGGVLKLLNLQESYGQLPSLRAEVDEAVAAVRKDEALATTLKQVEVYNQARNYAKRASSRPKAIAYLEAILAHFPDSQAAQYAQEELARLRGETEETPEEGEDGEAAR